MQAVLPRLVAAAAGACWLGALFVPWTARGTLSTASLIDAVRLVRRGTVSALVPAEAAAFLLVPALAGIVLIGVVGFPGRAAGVIRAIALVLGAAGSLVLAGVLTDLDASAAGPGTWVGAVGVLAALGAAALAVRSR